jgi:hypothetical protein
MWRSIAQRGRVAASRAGAPRLGVGMSYHASHAHANILVREFGGISELLLTLRVSEDIPTRSVKRGRAGPSRQSAGQQPRVDREL